MPRVNPYGAFNFKVICSRFTEAIGFMECSGLDGETMPMEYRDDKIPGGAGAFVRKLPGMERYPNVVLRRGITAHMQLWEWRKHIRDADQMIQGDLWSGVRADVTIELQNEAHRTVMSWNLQHAWPCKLSGPTLNARTNEIAIEQLELCCDRIEIVTAGGTTPPANTA